MRASLFLRSCARPDSQLIADEVEDIIDSFRPHVLFNIRPRLPLQIAPIDQHCDYPAPNVEQQSLGSFKWKWLVLDIPWAASESVTHPAFPLPVAALSLCSISGYTNLCNISALGHLFQALPRTAQAIILVGM